jgi:hypothetical protein
LFLARAAQIDLAAARAAVLYCRTPRVARPLVDCA